MSSATVLNGSALLSDASMSALPNVKRRSRARRVKRSGALIQKTRERSRLRPIFL
jgi:hypothetical protein